MTVAIMTFEVWMPILGQQIASLIPFTKTGSWQREGGEVRFGERTERTIHGLALESAASGTNPEITAPRPWHAFSQFRVRYLKFKLQVELSKAAKAAS